MRKKLSARLVDWAKDSLKFVEYMRHGSEKLNNLFSPSVMDYPLTQTIVVEDEDGPKLFNPQYPVMVMDSLAPKPGMPPIEEARVLLELMHATLTVAHNAGIQEIYFMCADENVIRFVQRYGFELVPHTVLRLKTKDYRGK